MTDAHPTQSSILRQWQRLPAAVRAVLSGVFVFVVLQQGWLVCFLANMKFLPQVPWNVPLGLMYLWFVFRFFSGHGRPASTAAARRAAMRARRLTRREWGLSLTYCALTFVFIVSIVKVVYAFIAVPESSMDLSMLPWWTLYPSLIMLSINAGVSEEAGFRGYMQGGLEERFGPVIAVIATSILFWLLHLNHADGMARVVLLIAYSVALGSLAHAARSIWPGIVAHALLDAISFTTTAGDFSAAYFFETPPPFSETGVTGSLVLFSLLGIGSILGGIGLLQSLSQTTRTAKVAPRSSAA